MSASSSVRPALQPVASAMGALLEPGMATMQEAILMGGSPEAECLQRVAPAPATLVPPAIVLAPPSNVTSYGHSALSWSGRGESRTDTS